MTAPKKSFTPRPRPTVAPLPTAEDELTRRAQSEPAVGENTGPQDAAGGDVVGDNSAAQSVAAQVPQAKKPRAAKKPKTAAMQAPVEGTGDLKRFQVTMTKANVDRCNRFIFEIAAARPDLMPELAPLVNWPQNTRSSALMTFGAIVAAEDPERFMEFLEDF